MNAPCHAARHPLATGNPSKGIVRILLSRAASDALTATGENAFAIVGKASHPEIPGRWVIHLAPVEWETAMDASRVLLGTHRAVKIKTK